jgi:hypothetical protein
VIFRLHVLRDDGTHIIATVRLLTHLSAILHISTNSNYIDMSTCLLFAAL